MYKFLFASENRCAWCIKKQGFYGAQGAST